MDTKTVRKFLLACRQAKRIVAMLPDLPDGVGPRDLCILDTVAQLSARGGGVRVSDVSEYMGVSRPGVTRDISRLEHDGFVRKQPSPDDGRIVFVSLTDVGARVQQVYAEQYHEHLAELLSDFDAAELDAAADTIGAVCAAMQADPARSASAKGGERR